MGHGTQRLFYNYGPAVKRVRTGDIPGIFKSIYRVFDSPFRYARASLLSSGERAVKRDRHSVWSVVKELLLLSGSKKSVTEIPNPSHNLCSVGRDGMLCLLIMVLNVEYAIPDTFDNW